MDELPCFGEAAEEAAVLPFEDIAGSVELLVGIGGLLRANGVAEEETLEGMLP